MLLEVADSQLVLVDYQHKLMPALHGGDEALANALRLAKAARLLGVPVWVTEENPASLGPTVPELAPLADAVVSKMAFAGADDLLPRLRPPARAPSGNARSLPRHLQKKAEAAPERETIVLAGCETHVCLMQTSLALVELEFDVWVVTDGCASRTERNRDAAFDRLAAAGAELVTTEMVLFEWIRTADHPRFKDVLALVK